MIFLSDLNDVTEEIKEDTKRTVNALNSMDDDEVIVGMESTRILSMELLTTNKWDRKLEEYIARNGVTIASQEQEHSTSQDATREKDKMLKRAVYFQEEEITPKLS